MKDSVTVRVWQCRNGRSGVSVGDVGVVVDVGDSTSSAKGGDGKVNSTR